MPSADDVTPERLERLAAALRRELAQDRGWSLARDDEGRWLLCGGVGGDEPLPMTAYCETPASALASAEAWYAPELAELAAKET